MTEGNFSMDGIMHMLPEHHLLRPTPAVWTGSVSARTAHGAAPHTTPAPGRATAHRATARVFRVVLHRDSPGLQSEPGGP